MISKIFMIFTVLKELIGISRALWSWVRQEYEKSQRAKVLNEIKEAVKESRDTFDNSRLVRIFDPHSEPFSRGLRKPEDSQV